MPISISPDGVAISERFFKVIDILTEAKYFRGLQTFTVKYGLNRRNIQRIKAYPGKTVLKTEILALLVRDFNVSGEWLLTGEGPIFRDGTDKPESVVWRNKVRQPKPEKSDM